MSLSKGIRIGVIALVALVALLIIVLVYKQNPITYTEVDPDVQPIEPEMVVIPGGSFQMGSDEGLVTDGPVHTVELSEYAIGKYEVTNEEYRRFCDATGRSYPPDPDFVEANELGRDYFLNNPRHPVVMISWSDMAAYALWLSDRTGKDYHLPTEAQWEKAARGGLLGEDYPWGSERLDGMAWMNQTWSMGPQEVGSFPPNGYGIHDMAGNVVEATWDWYQEDYYENSPAKDPTGPSGWLNYFSLISPIERSRLKGRCKTIRGGSYRAPWDYDSVGPDGLPEMPPFVYTHGWVYQAPYTHFDLGFRLARGGVWR
jgi:formylglycine-generating enzyme required for sulfatase activity